MLNLCWSLSYPFYTARWPGPTRVRLQIPDSGSFSSCNVRWVQLPSPKIWQDLPFGISAKKVPRRLFWMVKRAWGSFATFHLAFILPDGGILYVYPCNLMFSYMLPSYILLDNHYLTVICRLHSHINVCTAIIKSSNIWGYVGETYAGVMLQLRVVVAPSPEILHKRIQESPLFYFFLELENCDLTNVLPARFNKARRPIPLMST